jgi:ABC-2 type transport system permease protein
MAGMNPSLRSQLRAIGFLRWRLFINSLRSSRGRLNLLSRAIAALLVLGAACGGGFAFSFAAWGMTRDGQSMWLAVPFWLISIFWQLFPVMATAFTQNIDASVLLRFPLSYPGYFLVRLIYGALDIATFLGLSWSFALMLGIIAADQSLAPWALLATIAFVLFNLVLARVIFVWIEHWLSSRRSREVMGVLFLATMVMFQVAGPVLRRYSRWPAPQRIAFLKKVLPLERVLPPGLAAAVIANAESHQHAAALTSAALIVGYVGFGLLILHFRLHAQYHGETASAGDKPKLVRSIEASGLRRGWKLPLFSGPVSAVFEKEMRYFSRSGPMLFTLIMPLIMVLVLWGTKRALMGHPLNFVFPVGSAYCLLVMTNIIYNSFGGDGGGIQFFLFSPISFRQITAAKNLAQFTVLALDVFVLWIGVKLVFQAPPMRILVLTLTWLLFATPFNFAAGNLLSIYSPKRIDYAVFGRQRASETTILISLAVQLTVIATGALAIMMARHYHTVWAATAMLSALSVPSLAMYFLLLARVDRIAMSRRDVLTAELARA